jgi:phosphatidylglycerol:prolipoprotein diacylglycerol transferase
LVIPYIDVADFTLFGMTFHTFGLLVAIGVLVGHAISGRRIRALSDVPAHVFDLFAVFVFTGGFFIGHVFDVLAYRPEVALHDPMELLRVHRGLSSFGGVLGAFVGGYLFVYLRRLDAWLFTDACTYGFPFAWFFGRAGCAIAHDHKGRLSDAWIAVRFPEGARYDLGLVEWLFTPLLCALVVVVGRRAPRPGAVSGALAVAYAIMRFPLDFLRAADLGSESDRRYAGLTPGQWASIVTFMLGLWALDHARRHARYAAA